MAAREHDTPANTQRDLEGTPTSRRKYKKTEKRDTWKTQQSETETKEIPKFWTSGKNKHQQPAKTDTQR